MPRTPGERPVLGALSAATASQLLGASSDIALVIDRRGVIVEVVVHGDDAAARQARLWWDRPWVDTVTVESRPKIETMLRDALAAKAGEAARWRQVNHPIADGEDLPVLYATLRVESSPRSVETDRVVAFGRDLRPLVALQRQLVEAQQAMEQDYWRLREAETRYRHLLETSSEALLIVDGATQKVLDANPVARALFAPLRSRLVGATLASLMDSAHGEQVQDLLAAARSVGKKDAVIASLAGDGPEMAVSASVFRQDDAAHVLVRLLPARAGPERQPRAGGRPRGDAALSADAAGSLAAAVVQHSADAHVFCDAGGKVLQANRAFLSLAELSAEEQARGQPLDRWLGRTGVELSVLTTNLRQRGSVGRFVTTLRGEYGTRVEVEIAAAQLPPADAPVLAFSIRDIERRVRPEAEGAASMKRSVGELAELVGRTPLKDIVAETTDLIEQLCIQTALQMSNDNRASAAQLLGLSRQSLYVKLRRYGLGSLGGEA